MTAGDAVVEGRRTLARWRGASALAIGGAAVGFLAARAGAIRAAESWHAGLYGRAILTFLVGGGVAALLAVVTRAVTLSRFSRASWTQGIARAPAMITLAAVELTVLGMLALGVALVFLRQLSDGGAALQLAFVGAALAFPAVALAVALFAATRIAIALAARGVAPGLALVHGVDVVARRFPSLIRLALRLCFATLPLVVLAALFLAAQTKAPPRLGFLCAAAAAAVLAAATLWGYAALGVFVGRDPRLARG